MEPWMPQAARDRYWEDGFVLLPGLFDGERLARWDARFEAIVLGLAERTEAMVVMRDVMVVKGAVAPKTPLHAINKIMNFQDEPVLFEYALDARMLAAVRALVGHELMTISCNVFNKPPGVDGRHPLHQDLRYFALRPADGIVATWTALGPATRENGCLAVVPGSHRGPLRPHADPTPTPNWEWVNHGFFEAQGVDAGAALPVEMEPGDTLLFHPLLLHGSGHNATDGFRRAISTHYASVTCRRPGEPEGRDPTRRVRVPRRIPDG